MAMKVRGPRKAVVVDGVSYIFGPGDVTIPSIDGHRSVLANVRVECPHCSQVSRCAVRYHLQKKVLEVLTGSLPKKVNVWLSKEIEAALAVAMPTKRLPPTPRNNNVRSKLIRRKVTEDFNVSRRPRKAQAAVKR